MKLTYKTPGMKITLLPLWIALYIFVLPRVSFAQKRLPKVQASAIKAGSKMIIDGNINDWTKGFQAYNNRTNIYYSLAHDSTNIYLIVRAISYEAIKKILLGGVSLTLEDGSLPASESKVRIRYPAYDKYHPSWAINWGASLAVKDINFNQKEADSLMMVRNETLAKKAKLIAFKEQSKNADTLFSVYDAKGIKIRSRFDIASSYTMEWLIPLSFITSKDRSIRYRIELPGGSAGGVDVMVDTDRQVIFFTGASGGNYVLPMNAGNVDLASPTFFSGKYILAK
ncbi:hypothetical protein [Pedobacter sp. JCM 36344]|uniref:hypothetical protein n=1 Tax=Pedobacter sp. JCM 36344 TaxID=3374280 RepID=UPI00397BE3FD